MVTEVETGSTRSVEARMAQWQAVGEISNAASSILDLNELLPLAVALIRERFDLYYVGVFLLEERPEADDMVLRVGTGEAGRQMVAARHHFKVGSHSMIGRCAAEMRALIALDVSASPERQVSSPNSRGLEPPNSRGLEPPNSRGLEPPNGRGLEPPNSRGLEPPNSRGLVRFDNPLLPRTRSEMALPLIRRGQLVGAMTIQSTEPAAFDEDDITVLQVMAEQLANAIENARLFTERERRMTQMAVVNEIGQALSGALYLQDLYRMIHEQVGRLFDASNFYIATYEEGAESWTSAFHLEQGQLQPVARHSVGSGLTGWILRHRHAILFRTIEENMAFNEREGIDIIGEMAGSWLGVPLIAADKLVGAMAVQDYRRETLYDESDLALFSTIGAQVAVALDNVQLIQEISRWAREMEVVNEVGWAVASVLELDEVLRRLVDVTKEQFGYYFVSIALVEGDGIHYRHGSRIGDSDRRLELSELVVDISDSGYADGEPSRGLIAECVQRAEPVLVGDVLADPHYLVVEDLPDTRSELTVPIYAQGSIIGTLDVQSAKPFAFDETDVKLLQLLANQAGTAIENARLFAEARRRADEMGILHEVSLELAREQQELDTVLETITRRAMDLLDSDGGGIWLWREGAQELELVITFQVGDVNFAGRRLKPGEGLTGRAFVEKTIQVVDDYRAWNGRSEVFDDAPFAAGMSVPMLWQSEVVGALVLTRSEQDHPYAGEEQNLAELLAGQAAAVIQNARLFEQTQAQLSSLDTIQATLAQLNAALTFDDAIDALLPQAARVGQADRVRMYLLDGPRMICAGLYSSTGSDSVHVGDIVLLDDYPLTKKVVETGQALSVLADDPKLQPYAREAFKAAGLAANVTIPLLGREGAIGVLSLNRNSPAERFGEQDVRLAQTLADQAATVLEKDRLFEETQRRSAELQSLYETSLRMSTYLEKRELLRFIVERAVTLLGAETAGFYLYEPRSDELVFSVAAGYLSEHTGQRLQPGEGLAGRVLQERKAIVVEDYQAWPDHAGVYESEQRLGMVLGVPLLGRDAVLGVLDIAVARPPHVERSEGATLRRASRKVAFEERDIWLAELFAAQAATALENARLFEQARAQARRERMVREITARVRASTNPDTIVRTAVRELGTALGRPAFARLGSTEELAPTALAGDGGNGQEAKKDNPPTRPEGSQTDVKGGE